MKNLFEKFRGLPVSVRAAAIFLSLVALIAVIVIPHIAIPFLLIVGVVASLMRIFIYMVEERER